MSLVSRVARQLASARGRTQGALPCQQIAKSQRRSFASDHGHGVTYEGVTIHEPSKWHTIIGKGMAGVMWFWVMYRFYNDFDHFVYGPAAHFEHELHEEAHNSEAASH